MIINSGNGKGLLIKNHLMSALITKKPEVGVYKNCSGSSKKHVNADGLFVEALV